MRVVHPETGEVIQVYVSSNKASRVETAQKFYFQHGFLPTAFKVSPSMVSWYQREKGKLRKGFVQTVEGGGAVSTQTIGKNKPGDITYREKKAMAAEMGIPNVINPQQLRPSTVSKVKGEYAKPKITTQVKEEYTNVFAAPGGSVAGQVSVSVTPDYTTSQRETPMNIHPAILSKISVVSPAPRGTTTVVGYDTGSQSITKSAYNRMDVWGGLPQSMAETPATAAPSKSQFSFYDKFIVEPMKSPFSISGARERWDIVNKAVAKRTTEKIMPSWEQIKAQAIKREQRPQELTGIAAFEEKYLPSWLIRTPESLDLYKGKTVEQRFETKSAGALEGYYTDVREKPVYSGIEFGVGAFTGGSLKALGVLKPLKTLSTGEKLFTVGVVGGATYLYGKPKYTEYKKAETEREKGKVLGSTAKELSFFAMGFNVGTGSGLGKTDTTLKGKTFKVKATKPGQQGFNPKDWYPKRTITKGGKSEFTMVHRVTGQTRTVTKGQIKAYHADTAAQYASNVRPSSTFTSMFKSKSGTARPPSFRRFRPKTTTTSTGSSLMSIRPPGMALFKPRPVTSPLTVPTIPTLPKIPGGGALVRAGKPKEIVRVTTPREITTFKPRSLTKRDTSLVTRPKRPKGITPRPPKDLIPKPKKGGSLVPRKPQDIVIRPSKDIIPKPKTEIIPKPRTDIVPRPRTDIIPSKTTETSLVPRPKDTPIRPSGGGGGGDGGLGLGGLGLPGLGFPLFGTGGGGYGFRSPKFSYRRKGRVKYTPSLAAVTFGIYGSRPRGTLTGLEFRPLTGKPGKGKKKKRGIFYNY